VRRFKALVRLYKATRELLCYSTLTELNYSVVPGALVGCPGGVRLVSPILEVKHVTPLSKPLTWRETQRHRDTETQTESESEMHLVLAIACMHAAVCVCVCVRARYLDDACVRVLCL
jgi:hypothetical protein